MAVMEFVSFLSRQNRIAFTGCSMALKRAHAYRICINAKGSGVVGISMIVVGLSTFA